MPQAVGVGQDVCLLNNIRCYSPFRFLLFLVVLYFIASTGSTSTIYLSTLKNTGVNRKVDRSYAKFQ
jgi:hypothetical protein